MHHFYWRRSRDLFSRDDILAGLRTALERASNGRANLAELHEDSRIIEDVGLASLDLLELRCEMEERWQATVTDDQLMRLRTIGQAIELIEQQINKPG